MASVGLHLTKCAGTSLMTSMRRNLTEDKYLLISSFYENILASRAQPWEIVDFSRLIFVFGHYVSEDIFPLFRLKSIWDFFLFTGVREPTSRAISQYYQITKTTGLSLDVDNFISEYGSSMCDEIIRAFPSLCNPDQPKWLTAAVSLTVFDYIYSTEDYAQTIGPVYESIGLAVPSASAIEERDNIRITPLDSEIVSAIESAVALSDDAKLYSLIKPTIGQANAGKLIAELINTERKRELVFSKACAKPDELPTEFDFSNMYDMMGYELHLLGDPKKAEVIDILRQKQDQAAKIIQFLDRRVY
jgi:hypothetical protein